MKRLIIMAVLLISFAAFTTSASAATSDSQDCTLCHGTVVKDFNEPNVPVVNRVRCYQCHNKGLHTTSYNGTTKLVRIYYNDPVTGVRKPATFLQNPNLVPTVTLHAYHSEPDPRAAACGECHISFTCISCHETIPHKDHGITKYPQVSLWMTSGVFGGMANYKNSCATTECHGQFKQTYNPVISKTDGTQLCLNCHIYDKAGHVDAPAKHATVFATNPPFDCSGCHKSDLVTEHAARTNNNGVPYDCVTCHKNTRVDVQLAITAKNSKCDACHINYDHFSIHESKAIDNYCSSCHQGNLAIEHLQNNKTQKSTLTCATCHESTNVNVTYAIAMNKTACTACHTVGHNMNFIEGAPSDIPLYPGFEWSIPQDASIWAGELWFDAKFEVNAKRMFTNRKTNVSVQQIKDFYIPGMTSKGWSLTGYDNSNNTMVLNFVYGLRNAQILYYNSETPKRTTTLNTGFRLDIFYK